MMNNFLFKKQKTPNTVKNIYISTIPYPNKPNYNSIIPLSIYQTWYTKNLPPKMSKSVSFIKYLNPEFEHFLYDDNDCREFIKENFDENVLNAYDSLIPGAYKADLWRYCILYKKGGIYIDVRYMPYNGFQFINLTKKEHFVLDLPYLGVSGIYNALMACLPGNEILLKAINQIVKNVENNYYGPHCLYPTGPNLLLNYFNQNEKNNLELKHECITNNSDDKIIKFNNYIILNCYNGYTQERNTYSIKQHYGDLWRSKMIYKKK